MSRWFETGRNREVGPSREFHEELVGAGILSHGNFVYVRCDFIQRQIHRVRYSEYAQSFELLVADIYDVVLDSRQQVELEALQAGSLESSSLMWANADQIRRRGAAPGKPDAPRISVTAEWTL